MPISLLTEPQSLRDSLKALLHTIFFHRLFPAVRPLTRDVVFSLPSAPSSKRIHPARGHQYGHTTDQREPPTLTHALVDDPDLETTIAARVAQVSKIVDRQLQRMDGGEATVLLKVHFYEKKRKKAATGFANFWKDSTTTGSEVNGVCWETWEVRVRCVKSSGGARNTTYGGEEEGDSEEEEVAEKTVKESFRSLRTAIAEVMKCAGDEKDHIPPITSAESNPFPYEILVETAR